MIGSCDICDRQNVPVGHSHATSAHPEASVCFLCRGETDPDPYGELAEIESNPREMERVMDCKYRSHSGYCHRCCSFGACGEEALTEIRAVNSRPTTPDEWLKKYKAMLKICGLTARELAHYDELRSSALTSQQGNTP